MDNMMIELTYLFDMNSVGNFADIDRWRANRNDIKKKIPRPTIPIKVSFSRQV